MMSTPIERAESASVERPAEALAQLFRDRYKPMVRLAYLLTSDRVIAEELVQDAFVALHRHWERVTQPQAYLRTSVVNGCRSWGRRQVIERERQPAPAESVPFVADELWDALQLLPDRQRTAIVLRFYADLPDSEIADVLGCRPVTVRTSIHRALTALRKEIGQ